MNELAVSAYSISDLIYREEFPIKNKCGISAEVCDYSLDINVILDICLSDNLCNGFEHITCVKERNKLIVSAYGISDLLGLNKSFGNKSGISAECRYHLIAIVEFKDGGHTYLCDDIGSIFVNKLTAVFYADSVYDIRRIDQVEHLLVSSIVSFKRILYRCFHHSNIYVIPRIDVIQIIQIVACIAVCAHLRNNEVSCVRVGLYRLFDVFLYLIFGREVERIVRTYVSEIVHLLDKLLGQDILNELLLEYLINESVILHKVCNDRICQCNRLHRVAEHIVDLSVGEYLLNKTLCNNAFVNKVVDSFLLKKEFLYSINLDQGSINILIVYKEIEVIIMLRSCEEFLKRAERSAGSCIGNDAVYNSRARDIIPKLRTYLFIFDKCLDNSAVDQIYKLCLNIGVRSKLVYALAVCEMIGNDSASFLIVGNLLDNSLARSKIKKLRSEDRISHKRINNIVVNEIYKLRFCCFIGKNVVNECGVADKIFNKLLGNNGVLKLFVEKKLHSLLCQKPFDSLDINTVEYVINRYKSNKLVDLNQLQKHIEGEILSHNVNGKKVYQSLEIVNRYVVGNKLLKVFKCELPSFRQCLEDIGGNKPRQLLFSKVAVLQHLVDLVRIYPYSHNTVFKYDRVIVFGCIVIRR